MLNGPDLTNQIVGVIMRFLQEPAFIMGDIEAMFHQVLVPEKIFQKSLLRFLWWKDHNISGKAADFEIGVHAFGSVSFPSCSHYAFKQTVFDNETKYLPQLADILKRNLYVNNLLKSPKDIDTATRVEHDVINMCAVEGFCST